MKKRIKTKKKMYEKEKKTLIKLKKGNQIKDKEKETRKIKKEVKLIQIEK